MRILQLWKHDVQEGIWRRKIYFLLPVIVSLISAIVMHRHIENVQVTSAAVDHNSIMDYWVYFIKGTREYHFSIFNSFILPIDWLCIFVFLLIGLNNYMDTDLHKWGYQILLESKSRKEFWIAKLLWCVTYVMSYFVICFGVITIFALCSGAKMEFKVSRGVMNYIINPAFMKISTPQLLAYTFLAPCLLALLLGIIQMTISLIIKPLYAFFILMVMMVCSMYKQYIFFIGNWGMPYRMEHIVKGGYPIQLYLLLSIASLLIFTVLGIILFNHKDILEKN